jgi:hypothetical protein
MLKKAGSSNKNKKTIKFNSIKSASIVSLFVFILFISFLVLFSFCNEIYVIAGSSSYTPSSPSGNTTGDINVDHEYVVYTKEVGSCWMFDWGDGNYSYWIEVGVSDTFVSQTHSWNSYGVYEVRVKHRSVYMAESAWSPPLIVTITIPPDLDDDGWNNEVEEAYGKNPEDPNEYPIDTDGDGTPDEDSLDGNYMGDSNDDNDGLTDTIEESLGSNPKDGTDVINIIFKTTTYCLVDTNGDGNSDILYNSQTELQTKVLIKDGKTYLDTTGDGSWDYTYDGTVVSYKPFPWLYLLAAIILTVVIVIFLLFKTGILYLYEEEYVIEE